VTYRTPRLLVCVYYRVAAGDSPRVISTVREFQRTLQDSDGVEGVEVLLRCGLTPEASSAAPPDARTPSVRSLDPPPGPDARVDRGADATVMETYRLALPAAAGSQADAVVRAFLDMLEAAALPLAGLVRGARHVELFSPCAL
jgi:hypothetical protein